MEHGQWLDDLISPDSRRVAAARTGLSDATISRQLSRNGKLTPENVIALARVYGRSPADALVETGYLKADEVDAAGVPQALGYATNQQLYAEIMRRVDPDAVRMFRPRDVITPDLSPRTPVVHPQTWGDDQS